MSKTNLNIFPQRLTEQRNKCGIAQYVLSELLGMGHDTIRKYESGERIPSLERLCDIADYFGVSVDYLLGRE